MAVSKVFTAGNREFASESDAKKWDEVLAAKETLDNAIRRVSNLLGESAKTKDGHAFEWSMLKDYFLVHEIYGREPSIEKLSIYVHYATVEDDSRTPGLVIRLYEPNDRNGRNYRDIRIDELYDSEKAANAELIAAYERYVADVRKQLDNLKKGKVR